MEVTLSFYKKNDRWYADVQGHTEEENEMVLGADVMLDILSNHGDQAHLLLSDEHNPNYDVALMQITHDDNGAEYIIKGCKDPQYADYIGYTVWICNVTHDVFGEHPLSIFIERIQVEPKA